MAVLAIRIYPDPVLRVKCREVTEFDDRLRKLVRDGVPTVVLCRANPDATEI